MQPWPRGSDGWSMVLYAQRLQVWFLVNAHVGGNQSCFSFSPSLSLQKSVKTYPWVMFGEDYGGGEGENIFRYFTSIFSSWDREIDRLYTLYMFFMYVTICCYLYLQLLIARHGDAGRVLSGARCSPSSQVRGKTVWGLVPDGVQAVTVQPLPATSDTRPSD